MVTTKTQQIEVFVKLDIFFRFFKYLMGKGIGSWYVKY